MAVSSPVRTPSRSPAPREDLEALRTQLKLARAQNAYLHRQLAEALATGPVQAETAATVEGLETANTHLATRLAMLTLHYQDAQGRITYLTELLNIAHKALGWAPVAGSQTTLAPAAETLEPFLLRLLALAHPDKWSQGQPATALAHELSVAITALRAQLQER